MKKNYIKIFLFFALVVVFSTVISYAAPAPTQSSALAGKVCDIRQLFCGGGAMAVVAFSIGVLGLLSFTGRMHWSVALVAAAGIIIFIGADQFIADITDGAANIDENCECL